MKREKPAGLRSNDKIVKPSKKLKVRITSDDQSPSEAGQSKEANNTPVYPSGRVTRAKAGGETSEATKNISDDRSPSEAGQSKEANNTPVYPSGRVTRAKAGGKTSEATKSISNGKKTPGKQEKAAELRSPVIKSARKKGEISADNKGQKTLPEGAKGTVQRLQEAVTLLMNLSGENNPLNPEAETPQSFTPLSPETTGNQEDTEANADTTVRREMGRPDKIRRQAKLPETPLGVTMTDANALAVQAPVIPPPVRTDDQILSHDRWVAIGKSNCYLDMDKIQPNPIYKLAVDILKQTNFFRAFIACSTIPAIYIQQFWDTVRYDKDTARYSCQLDEQWFNLTKDTIRDALQITPVIENKPFTSPPAPDELINFVNDLGYPKTINTLSSVVTHDTYQPWRAILTIINLCLTGKTSGFERLRAPMIQMLWGILNNANIDYAERIWEEFTHSIHSFIVDNNNLAIQKIGKKKINLLMIPNIRFTKLIIFHLQSVYKFHPRLDSPLHLPDDEHALGYLKFAAKGTRSEVFGKAIPEDLITSEILNAPYYQEYLIKVDKHQRFLAGEQVSAKLRKKLKGKKGKKTKDVPMDEDEEIDWDAAIDEGMEHIRKENIEGGEKERFSENKGGTSMTSLGNEEHNSEDNEGMDDDDDNSYRWVRRNEKRQTPNPSPRRSTRTTSIQKAPPKLKPTKYVPTPPTEPLIAPIPTTQEQDEMSYVTVAQMKTVMSTAIAHVNEQIEKAVADQFKKYLASQHTTSQPTASSTQHPNTSGPQHNYKDFEFEELKKMMLAHMLDQPELRNAKPTLFGCLYRGADLERTCTTNILRKRLHDDLDSDNH